MGESLDYPKKATYLNERREAALFEMINVCNEAIRKENAYRQAAAAEVWGTNASGAIHSGSMGPTIHEMGQWSLMGTMCNVPGYKSGDWICYGGMIYRPSTWDYDTVWLHSPSHHRDYFNEAQVNGWNTNNPRFYCS